MEQRHAQPFQWGVNDCCLFVCDWVQTLIGIDPAADLGLRGTYTDALGAARVLQDLGSPEDIAVAAATKYGWVEVPVAYAQRGDVVSLETPNGLTLAVCMGSVSAAPAEKALGLFPTLNCRRAWRIN